MTILLNQETQMPNDSFRCASPARRISRRKWKNLIKKIANPSTAAFLKMEADIDAGEFFPPYELSEHNRDKTLIKTWKAEKNIFSEFLRSKDHVLGHVYAGSGREVVKHLASTANEKGLPSTVDWALIDIEPSRLGDNIVC